MGWQDDEVVAPSGHPWEHDEIVKPAPAKGFELLSDAGGASPQGANPLPTQMPNVPSPAAIDKPLEAPPEQRLMDSIQSVGNGMGLGMGLPKLAEGIGSLAKAGIAKMGSKAATEVAEAPKSYPSLDETPLASEAPKTAPEADIPPSSTVPPSPTPEAPPTSTPKPEGSVPSQVRDYINNKYQAAREKPGVLPTIQQYAKEEANKMALKTAGARPGQLRQLLTKDPEATEKLGQFMFDQGYMDPKLGPIGMRSKAMADMDAAGKALGNIRAVADTKGAAIPKQQMIQMVKDQLDPRYTKGATGATHGAAYQTALKEIMDSPESFSGYAEAATRLNKLANSVKLTQPTGPFTDVANVISRINNDALKKAVPDLAEAYENGARQYGALHKVNAFLTNAKSREYGGRMTPGGVLHNVAQDALDRFGYRMGANTARKVANNAGSMKGMAKSLPEFFKDLIHDVDPIGDLLD